MSRNLSRRQFVKAVAAASLAGPLLLTSARGQKKEANDRIQLGFIGVGTMGRGHLNSFKNNGDVQIVAVCDVVKERREDAKRIVEEHYGKDKKNEYKGCNQFKDFRELLQSKDIDAVVIATPDHWHAIPCVLAARAKKDIYCEKPLTLYIAQGRTIVDEVKKTKVIFQTGSQQRSEYADKKLELPPKFRLAVEMVRNGRIGKLKTIRIGVGDPAVPCDLPEQEVPEGTDWEMWNGPSPKRGYNEILCPKGIHKGFPAWRRYREYAGGILADMGAHHFDIAQWALDMDHSGPVTIEPPKDEKEKRGLRFVYANGVEMFHGGPSDCTFEGSDGTIDVGRGKLVVKPADMKKEIGKDEKQVYRATDHRQNWIECIRSRKDPICTAEIGHRSASVCHLANIGYQLRRPLKWDPAKEKFVNDDEANRLVDRVLREPWKL